MAGKVCFCCKQSFAEHLIVTCNICRNTFGNSCTGMSASEVRVVNSKKAISWSCKSCERMGNDLNSLKGVIVALQQEVKDLKIALESVQCDANTMLSDETFEQIMLEFDNRQQRKNNIVLFGLQEQPSNISGEESRVQDNHKVTEVITYLSKDVSNVSSLKIMRIGKPNRTTNKPRPVKITLSNAAHVRSVLKNSKNLRKSPQYSHLSISSDKTPRQQLFYQKVKSDLEKRRADGESIQLKFVHGVPTIVPQGN